MPKCTLPNVVTDRALHDISLQYLSHLCKTFANLHFVCAFNCARGNNEFMSAIMTSNIPIEGLDVNGNNSRAEPTRLDDLDDSEHEQLQSPDDFPGEPQEQVIQEPGFIKLNTHDVSFVEGHVPSISKFAEDLQVALNGVWPNRKQSRYGAVYVLLLSWEDDNLGVEHEIRRLGHVFSHLYHFDAQIFKIPRRTPGKATTSRISSFLENDGIENLLIVYYAGHARLSKQTNEPAIWTA